MNESLEEIAVPCGTIKTLLQEGQKFSKWTVISNSSERDGHAKCRCECGVERLVRIFNLTGGKTFSCGCGKKSKLIDLTGQKFGKLTVIDKASLQRKKGVPLWEVLCECGNKSIVRGEYLRYGHTRSCGCLSGDHLVKMNSIHHRSQTDEHRIWRGIIQRCLNPNNSSLEDYGRRGVTICDRWLNGDGHQSGFQCFLQDMGERPNPSMSVERVDN